MKIIYGAGTGFYKPKFYNFFIAFVPVLEMTKIRYGVRPMFAILNNVEHGERRKTISNVYAKSYIMTPPVEELIQDKTRDLMNRIKQQLVSDMFFEFHNLSCDIITRHVWGKPGETLILAGKPEHKELLDDVLEHQKASWIWSVIHFPILTDWFTEPGWPNTICQTLGLLRKGTYPYTSIRQYAYDQTINYYKGAVGSENASVMAKMVKYHVSQGGDWSDADLAAGRSGPYVSWKRYDSRISVLLRLATFTTSIPSHSREITR